MPAPRRASRRGGAWSGTRPSASGRGCASSPRAAAGACPRRRWGSRCGPRTRQRGHRRPRATGRPDRARPGRGQLGVGGEQLGLKSRQHSCRRKASWPARSSSIRAATSPATGTRGGGAGTASRCGRRRARRARPRSPRPHRRTTTSSRSRAAASPVRSRSGASSPVDEVGPGRDRPGRRRAGQRDPRGAGHEGTSGLASTHRRQYGVNTRKWSPAGRCDRARVRPRRRRGGRSTADGRVPSPRPSSARARRRACRETSALRWSSSASTSSPRPHGPARRRPRGAPQPAAPVDAATNAGPGAPRPARRPGSGRRTGYRGSRRRARTAAPPGPRSRQAASSAGWSWTRRSRVNRTTAVRTQGSGAGGGPTRFVGSRGPDRSARTGSRPPTGVRSRG